MREGRDNHQGFDVTKAKNLSVCNFQYTSLTPSFRLTDIRSQMKLVSFWNESLSSILNMCSLIPLRSSSLHGTTKHGTQSSYWCYTCLQGEDCSTPLMGSLVPCFSHIVFSCISGDGRPVGCIGRRWGLGGAEWPWRVFVAKLWNSFQWEWKPEIGRGCTPSLKSYF